MNWIRGLRDDDVPTIDLLPYVPDAQAALAAAAEVQEQRIEMAIRKLDLLDDYYQTGGDLKSHMAHLAQEAKAALTAAVGETEFEALEEHQALLRAHADEARTIERCAQVANEFDNSKRIVDAIRALKEKL